jgi:hypothetical protein
MELFPSFKAQTRDARLTPGVAFCGFVIKAKWHLGFVLTRPNDTIFISMSLGVPRGATPDDAAPLMTFKRARIRLLGTADLAHTGKEIAELPGAIVLMGGGLGLVVLGQIREAAIFNLENGEEMATGEHKKDFHPYFPRWSVETDNGHSWETLFSFDLDAIPVA